ncbi:MAG TPA: DUF898 family protein [Xanthobacteraceae bacterium]|jgi:uncharacterized membrane protein YjgN (DUF898 family)|nr:DUF898 family protein [Xanthobacteraceae bacterium]
MSDAIVPQELVHALGPDVSQETGRSAHVVFTGKRRDFFRLVRRGAMLELVTAGFYRFWLATGMRRALWSGTSVDGDPAEYTGTAKELLIGFLFALAILAPIYLVYFLIGIEAERVKAFASFPLVLFFYAFGQFAIFRARRYRATRTVWRGVRFWMSGSGWAYAWRAFWWSLFALLTLGLALPWRESALERYKMRHLHYGDLQARFDGTGRDLFKQGIWLWLGLIVAIAFFLSIFFLPSRLILFKRSAAVVLALSFVIALPFVYSIYKAIVWRWWINGIHIGEVWFKSDLDPADLMGVYWATIGWGSLLVIADGVAIGSFMTVVMIPLLTGGHANAAGFAQAFREHPYLLIGANVLNYLVLGLCAGIISRVYLLREVWERVVTSATAHNLECADNVQARGDLASALGEGFADGLDVAGF